MTHLDELTLNEYLDHTLDTARNQAVENHLAVCPSCQQSLAELQFVFAALTAVADVPLATDLSPRVLQTIQPETATPTWVSWVLLAQLAGVMWMLVRVWPLVQGVLAQGQTTIETAVREGVAALGSTWAAWMAWGTAVWQQPPTIPPVLHLAVSQWLWLLVLAFVVWLVGNQLLINER